MSAETVSNNQGRRGRSWFLVDKRLLAFNEWVRKHYGNQEALADEVGTNRAHLSQVLGGTRTGGHTWRRIVRILPDEGLSLLQQCPSWNTRAQAELQARRAREAQAAAAQKIVLGAGVPASQPQPIDNVPS